MWFQVLDLSEFGDSIPRIYTTINHRPSMGRIGVRKENRGGLLFEFVQQDVMYYNNVELIFL